MIIWDKITKEIFFYVKHILNTSIFFICYYSLKILFSLSKFHCLWYLKTLLPVSIHFISKTLHLFISLFYFFIYLFLSAALNIFCVLLRILLLQFEASAKRFSSAMYHWIKILLAYVRVWFLHASYKKYLRELRSRHILYSQLFK